ncbi:MAG: GNAT family N-acetyltransferase [Anaeroplasmataceae bacterium]|nr:GNAT family N-acetyltransferase [Anaeroplasmataceae bacterium]
MHIITNRLIIRDFCADDVNDLHEILGDAEVMQYCEPAYTFEQTQSFLQDFCIKKRGAFAVVQQSNQKIIGYVLFNAWENSVYEIGWIFNKKFWRQGFAYEACSNIISYAFEKLNINKIVAETIDRQKSVKLMEKLGMKLVKVQKNETKDTLGNIADLYIYELIQNNQQ